MWKLEWLFLSNAVIKSVSDKKKELRVLTRAVDMYDGNIRLSI